MECAAQAHDKKDSMILLKIASDHFLSGNTFKAIPLYEISKTEYYDVLSMFDMCTLEYALTVAYTRSPCHFHKATEKLTPFVVEHGNIFPPLYYGLAILLFQQGSYGLAESIIGQCLEFISNLKDSSMFVTNWPGSNVPIPESNTIILKSMAILLQKNCKIRMSSKTTEKCVSDDDLYQNDSSKLYLFNDDGTISDKFITEIRRQKLIFKPDVPKFAPKHLADASSSLEFCHDVNSNTTRIDKFSQTKSKTITVSTQTHMLMNDRFLDTKCTTVKDEISTNINLLNKQLTETIHVQEMNKRESIGKQEHICNYLNLILSKLSDNNHLQEKNKRDALGKQEHVCNNLNLILSKLTENNELREKIKILEEEARAQTDLNLKLTNDYKQLEKESDRTQIKLKVQLEEVQKIVDKLENKIEQQERKIKYLESSTIEQLTLFYSSQKQQLSRRISKCISMISDLRLASRYLTPTSSPTIDQCHSSIRDWDKLLNVEQKHVNLIEQYYRLILNGIQNNDQCRLNQPPFHVDIEIKDILHDNYVPAVIYFIGRQPREQYVHFPPSNHNMRNANYVQSQPPRRYNPLKGPPLRMNQNTINRGTVQLSLPPTVSHGRPIVGPKENVLTCSEHTTESESFINVNHTNLQFFQATGENKTTEGESQKESSSFKNESEAIIEFVETEESQISDGVSLKPNTDEIIQDEIVQSKAVAMSLEIQERENLDKTKENIKTSIVDNPKIHQSENIDDSSNDTERANSAASSSHLGDAKELTNLNESIENVDIQVPAAVKAFGGPKFCNLFIHIRRCIANVSDDDLLSALKLVKKRKIKLSGMSKENIIASVLEELTKPKDRQEYVFFVSTLLLINYFLRNRSSDVNTESYVCAICLDPYDQASEALLKCHHSFHIECIKQWFTTNSICPICRLHTTGDEGFRK